MILSIIIPVYNVEPYLSECLDSVFQQNLTDFEVICVNDGSTDNSRKILEDYKLQHCEITIVNQENKGLSAARNAGLNIATGKYIYCLDSDDYLLPGRLHKVIDSAEKDDTEVVTFNASVNGEFEYINKNFNFNKVVTGQEYYEEFYKNNNSYPQLNVWLYLYKKSFLDLHKLKFKPGVLYEDELFSHYVYILSKRILYLPLEVLHYRRYRVGGITTKITPKHLYNKSLIYKELYKFYNNNKISYRGFYHRLTLGYIGILNNAVLINYNKIRQEIFSYSDFKIMNYGAINDYTKKLTLLALFNIKLMHKFYNNSLPAWKRRSINILFTLMYGKKYR